MEHCHVEAMVESVGGHARIRVPEASVEGNVLVDPLAHLHHRAHGHLPMICVRDIVDRDLGRALGLLVELVGNDDETVDGIVHGNHLGLVLLVDQHRADDALAAPDHQTGGSVEVVHPARQWLEGGGRNCRRSETEA